MFALLFGTESRVALVDSVMVLVSIFVIVVAAISTIALMTILVLVFVVITKAIDDHSDGASVFAPVFIVVLALLLAIVLILKYAFAFVDIDSNHRDLFVLSKLSCNKFDICVDSGYHSGEGVSCSEDRNCSLRDIGYSLGDVGYSSEDAGYDSGNGP